MVVDKQFFHSDGKYLEGYKGNHFPCRGLGQGLKRQTYSLNKSTRPHQPTMPTVTEQPNLSSPLMEARNVWRYFTRSAGFLSRKKSFAAVHDVSLQVKKGLTLGIIGESGCGKSTLGKMLAGLLPPSTGEIVIGGSPVYATAPRGGFSTLPHEVCKTVQMIFQDPNASLNPRMRIGKSVSEPLQCLYPEIGSSERTQRVLEILAEVGISPDYANRYPHAFSGGQRQRIAIARALVTNPSVIVCDEPTSSLDSSVQAQVLNLLDASQKRYDVAYVFISHDLAVVRHMSDEVAVMYSGAIVEQGPSEEVFSNPVHPYTHLLLDSVPSLTTFKRPSDQSRPNAPQPMINPQQPNKALQPDEPPQTDEPQGCPFAPRCPKAIERCYKDFPALNALKNRDVPAQPAQLAQLAQLTQSTQSDFIATDSQALGGLGSDGLASSSVTSGKSASLDSGSNTLGASPHRVRCFLA